MYRSSDELPQWRRSSSPTFKRTHNTRRNRFIFIIAICLIAWYHCSTQSLPKVTESSIDASIQIRYPKGKSNVVSYAANLQTDEDLTIQKVEKLHEKGADSPILKATDDQDQNISTRKGRDEQQIIGSPRMGVSPEYADDDAAPRNAVKGNLGKIEAAHGHGVSETIDQKLPQLVKQASDKGVEQHLAPAPKYEEEIATPKPQPSGPKRSPPYTEYAMLDEKAEALPDIVHIPFEVSTADVVLEGWEDEWFANADLDVAKWGKL